MKWIIAGILFALTVFVHLQLVEHAVHKNDEEWRVQLRKLEEDKEKLEESFRKDSDDLKKEKDDKIKTLNSRISVLNKRLLERPSREASVSETPRAGEACTGAQLYREDGLFLTGEAARADGILTERNYYYEQYEKVRKKLDEQNRSE